MSPLFFACAGRAFFDVFSIKNSNNKAGTVIAIIITNSEEVGGSKLGVITGSSSRLAQLCFVIG